jgi:hypothetical protein
MENRSMLSCSIYKCSRVLIALCVYAHSLCVSASPPILSFTLLSTYSSWKSLSCVRYTQLQYNGAMWHTGEKILWDFSVYTVSAFLLHHPYRVSHCFRHTAVEILFLVEDIPSCSIMRLCDTGEKIIWDFSVSMISTELCEFLLKYRDL